VLLIEFKSAVGWMPCELVPPPLGSLPVLAPSWGQYDLQVALADNRIHSRDSLRALLCQYNAANEICWWPLAPGLAPARPQGR
jgi:hypothetical protein